MFWHPSIDPAKETPQRVVIKRDVFVDPARGNRRVPFKFYYPEGSASILPLVVWSHGLGGSADGAAFLSRFIAGHGYAVINIQHIGTDSVLWEGKPGHPWDNIRAAEISDETVRNRFLDVPFVLDSLPGFVAGIDGCGTLDFSKPGMSGHSFGALTTQVMAGQFFPDADGKPVSFRESRFTAGILYSPVPMTHLSTIPGPELYAGIAMPLLHMTGTADDSPMESFGFKERLAVFNGTKAPDQDLLVLEGGDHMVFVGSRGQLGENPHRKLQEEQIRMIALAYWEARLKDNAAAKAWLEGDGVAAYLGATGTYRHKAS